jgi:hypothetical protein
VPIADDRQVGLDEVVAAFTRAGVQLHPRQVSNRVHILHITANIHHRHRSEVL